MKIELFNQIDFISLLIGVNRRITKFTNYDVFGKI